VIAASAAMLGIPTSTALGAEDSHLERASSWFSENFEVHGFVRSRFYVRSPDFGHEPVPNSLRTELNLEPELRLYSDDDWDVSFYAVVRPIYEAVYDFKEDLYGQNVQRAAIGTGGPFPGNGNANESKRGRAFPGDGGRVDGEFSIINSDTGSFFTGKPVPAIAVDDVVFFGRVTAPVNARGEHQDAIGGNADGKLYRDLQGNFGSVQGVPALNNGGLPLGLGLDASLNMASMPLTTPLNFYYGGGIGDRSSLDRGSADLNANENEIKFDCFDNAHPHCFFREYYFDVTWKNTFMRLGKQQIVWGKTDAFRLQDTVNPIDFGFHNVFPDLEERRIPQLSLDVIHSFGNLGPFEDVSLEFAWVFDRFLPDQFGQCGENWAFTAACEARADAGGHGLFNFSLAGVDDRQWTFGNTQPGGRLEFRLPDPSIAFSLSAFYGFQKLPVARYRNHASTDNPNAAVMLFLQGITDATGTPVAGTIDALAALGGPNPYSGGVWLTGFDPYDRTGPTPNPGGTLEAANFDLQNAWFVLTNVLTPATGGCSGIPDGEALEGCIGAISIFGLPWSASEAELEYARIWSLGASMDYQIPNIDTVLRLEIASDIQRKIQNTRKLDQIDESSVFKAAIGLDRSTFIPFLNRNRTAFISFQTFIEHIVDYQGELRGNDGMVPYETNVISTLFMQNYWRNDSVILTNLFAIDWNSDAIIFGPSLRWILNQNLSFDFGLSLLWGQGRRHNIRDFCSDGTLSCIGDPTTWQDGNWQLLNGPARRTSETPYWGQQSFADRFMRKRDEFWLGFTYQF
jgi:hypothetical protein